MSDQKEQLLTSDIVRMLVTSLTKSGEQPLTELEAERFLNALTRAQSGVPTGARHPNGPNA